MVGPLASTSEEAFAGLRGLPRAFSRRSLRRPSRASPDVLPEKSAPAFAGFPERSPRSTRRPSRASPRVSPGVAGLREPRRTLSFSARLRRVFQGLVEIEIYGKSGIWPWKSTSIDLRPNSRSSLSALRLSALLEQIAHTLLFVSDIIDGWKRSPHQSQGNFGSFWSVPWLSNA